MGVIVAHRATVLRAGATCLPQMTLMKQGDTCQATLLILGSSIVGL